MAIFGDMADHGDPLTERETQRVNLIVSRSVKPSFGNESYPLMPDDASYEIAIQGRVIDCLDRYQSAAELNKSELASYVGVSDRTIRNWRSDAHKACSMDADTCEKLTIRLFTSLDWLRYGTDHMPDGDTWDPSIVEWYYMCADAETRADVCHALRRGAEIQRLAHELENAYEAIDPLISELMVFRRAANT